MRSLAALVVSLAAISFAVSQNQLTLEEALRLSQARNGNVAAAFKTLDAAKARVNQANSAYLPTITPSVSYTDSRTDTWTGAGRAFNPNINSGTTSGIKASWQLLDSGERTLFARSAKKSYEAEALDALLTVRSTLLTVHSQYFDTLRFQELVKVQTAQVNRANAVKAQVEAEFKVGEAAEKDIYQPQADALNAEVELLATKSRLAKAQADLKATIGWEPGQLLPELATYGEPGQFVDPGDRDKVIAEALMSRLDLRSQQLKLESQEANVRRTQVTNGLTWSLDANYTKQFGPDNLNNRMLQFSASFPLFDGARSKEAVREAKLGLEASKLSRDQSTRTARAEVEAAYDDLNITILRIKAAKAAQNAAKINYDKISKSYTEFRVGTVVDVSTAQLSLATAEKNLIDAIFDYYIADVRLRLVTGREVPGEAK